MMTRAAIRVALCSALTLIAVALLPGQALAHEPAEVHLALGAMEITQSVQTKPQLGLASSVPLSAHKPTTIRAYVSGTRLFHFGLSHFPSFGGITVNGTLTVSQGGSTIAVLPAANGPITITPWSSPSPASANSSLNFNLASPPVGSVSFALDLTAVSAGVTATDPPAQIATFVHNQRVRIEGVRLQYDHDANPFTPPTKTPDPALVANGMDWFKKSGPLAPCKLQYWVNPTPLQWTSDLSSTSDPGAVLRSTLAGMRVQGSVTYDQVYGWWQGGVSGNGNSSLPGSCPSPVGRGSYGNTDPTRHQRTFTHELYHNYHQVHYADGSSNWSCDAHPGADNGSGQIGVVGWDTSVGAPVPATKLDVMVPGQLTNAAWQDAARYSLIWNLWDDPGIEPLFDTCHFNWWTIFPLGVFVPYGPLLPVEEELPEADFLLVTGSIDPQRGGSLMPAWRLKRPILPDPPDGYREGEFAVQLVDTTGQVIDERRFTPEFHTDSDLLIDYGFDMRIATPMGPAGGLNLSEIRLVDLVRNATLAGLRVSASLPAVQILAPDPRQTPLLDKPFEVRWAGSDQDGDPLVYSLQYSPDGGQHYMALANNLKEPLFIGDPDELPGGSSCWIRVMASDGVHVGETLVGPFEVPRKGPTVAIVSPEGKAAGIVPCVRECGGLVLQGVGTSPDDGVLPGDMLEWFSDIQGPLGKGYAPPNPCLRAGTHTITLVGTDKAGRQASDTIVIDVEPEGRDSDADGTPDYADRCPDAAGPPDNDGCPYGPETMPIGVKVDPVDASGGSQPTADSFFDVFFDITLTNPRTTDVTISGLRTQLGDPSGAIQTVDLPLPAPIVLTPGGSRTLRHSFFDVFTSSDPVYGEHTLVAEAFEGLNMPAGRGGTGFTVVPSLGGGCRPLQVGGPLGWAANTPMPDRLNSATGVIVGRKIFVTHGEGAAAADTAGTWVYDIPSDSWAMAATAGVKRANLTGVCVERPAGAAKLLAIGGRSLGLGTALADLEIYDPAANAWAPGVPMPTPRRGAGAAFVPGPGVAGGKLGSVYVVGGSDGLKIHDGTPLDANEAYDVELGVWVRKAPMIRPMMDVYSTTYHPGTRKIYVFGGFDGLTVRPAVGIYDPATDSWTAGSSMPTPRSNLISGICGRNLYAIGGLDAAGPLAVTETYDPLADAWIAGAPAKPTAAAEMASQFVYSGTDIHAIAGRIPGAAASGVNERFTCGAAVPFCHSDADCDDGVFCNGREVCLQETGSCQPGTPPACSDQNPCTADRCDVQSDRCVNPPLSDSETADGEDGLCGTADDNPELYGADGLCGTADDLLGDGFCDTIDNCPTDYNPDQSDRDADGLGDACDCAPSDPGTPTPGPVGQTLRLTHAPATALTTLSWDGIPTASQYNTYRGTIPSTMMGSRAEPYDHGCFERDDAQQNGATTSVDRDTPPVGTAHYYDNSGSNGCGEGPLGSDSNGVPRPNPTSCEGGSTGPGYDTPPHIDPPAATGQIACVANPAALPAGASAALPAFEGEPLRVNLPVVIQDLQTADEVRQKVILPILQALGTCFERGEGAIGNPPPGDGLPQTRGSFPGLAADVDYEYVNNPELLRPRTRKMIDVFLGLIPPDDEINNALEMGEGMTFPQFVANIERLEILYPFPQLHNGVPIEHTILLAARWEGQAVTSVRGALLNKYSIGNTVMLDPGRAVPIAIGALRATPGVADVLSKAPEDGGPYLVLLPYGSDAQGMPLLRYAYRMTLRGVSTGFADGPFLLWLDAQTGDILKLVPLFSDVSASGRVYKRDAGLTATTQFFQVDPASGGQYVLKLAGVMNRVDYQGNGFNSADISISDSSGGSSGTFANFNQSPYNNQAQALCASGTNKGFQQVNFFASLYRYRQTVLSNGIFTPFPASVWSPKVEVKRCSGGTADGSVCTSSATCTGGGTCAQWCNANASMTYGACEGYFGSGCPDVPNAHTNFAHDNTIVAHELAHSITPRLTSSRPADWCCPGPACGACPIPLGWSKFHDLADFWADHFENINCTSGWTSKNKGGGVNASLYCSPNNVETGSLPRAHEVTVPFNPGDALDHFPEHRGPGTSSCSYDDGQIGAAALWQVRLGMRSKCRPSGTPQFGVRYQRALKNTGFLGFTPACSDKGIYEHLYDLESEMTEQWATSGSPGGPPAFAHNGPHTTNKVTAGFARAGIFLVPPSCLDGGAFCASGENGADAVIDIDDQDLADDLTLNGVHMPEVDFLELGGATPRFHVWTGPRYRLNGVGGDATFPNPSPCNKKFKVEVSTSAAFPPASIVDSPWLEVDTDPTTPESPECYGTWQIPPGHWNMLQEGGALTRIYYRVRTRDAADGNEKISTSPGRGLWTVPPPYAVITTDGQSDY